MQLTKFTDYGLRVLIYLAATAPEKATAAAIARAYGISENHLSKVCTDLVQGGFVTSQRGRTGGLALARDVSDISVGDVVRHLSRDDAVVECFSGKPCDCALLPGCGLRGPLATAQEAFLATLDGVSLARIARQPDAIRQLLSLK